MSIQIRQAEVRDVEQVSRILIEAAEWRERGIPLLRTDDLVPERLAADGVRGDFFIAEFDGEFAGTVRFQLQDKIFWPEVSAEEAVFLSIALQCGVHPLADTFR